MVVGIFKLPFKNGELAREIDNLGEALGERVGAVLLLLLLLLLNIANFAAIPLSGFFSEGVDETGGVALIVFGVVLLLVVFVFCRREKSGAARQGDPIAGEKFFTLIFEKFHMRT